MVAALLWAAGRHRCGRWARTGQGLYRLTPTEFEEAVADILRCNGWKDVKVQGGAGDRGADVIGTDPDGRRVVVQAKRYAASNKVGSQDVQVLIGSQRIHGAERAMIVTTSGYTAAAVELADEFGDVDLIDGRALGRMAA
ncbi:restriction endonuclease [Euzebya pacifica]|uniref:restriction endonuclease n=1 Tax=Euzebya pacifica TaxID=1608957 RepID=UPI001FE61C41|nr:restriction endonuclease [Euzebya pacifica]